MSELKIKDVINCVDGGGSVEILAKLGEGGQGLSLIHI